MPNHTIKEKREFVRTPLNIEARITLLQKADADRSGHKTPAFSSLPLLGESETDAESSDPLKTTVAYLTDFMFQMNEKLDRIMALLGGGECASAQIRVHETINISGSGICMVVADSLDVGMLLDVSLFIPNFPLGVFSVQGEIVRVTPRKIEDSKQYEIGIRFINLSEEQRERLIAYTFRQQRRTIRDTKEYN